MCAIAPFGLRSSSGEASMIVYVMGIKPDARAIHITGYVPITEYVPRDTYMHGRECLCYQCAAAYLDPGWNINRINRSSPRCAAHAQHMRSTCACKARLPQAPGGPGPAAVCCQPSRCRSTSAALSGVMQLTRILLGAVRPACLRLPLVCDHDHRRGMCQYHNTKKNSRNSRNPLPQS